MRKASKIGVRLVIALAVYCFIAIKLGRVGLLNVSRNLSDSLSTYNLCLLGIVIALMPLVWALESFKWRYALLRYTKISFWRSWRSVWYGLVAGQLTPNRIGEPIGRLALIDPDVRGKAGFIAILCSFTQQIATIAFGFLGIVWWTKIRGFEVLPSGISLGLIFIAIFCWICLVLLGIIKVQKIFRWLEGFRWVNRYLQGERLILDFRVSTFFLVQLISLIRYVVFSTQFVILLIVFGIDASITDLYAVVALTYLFSSFVPSFSVSEVGIKAGFAIWFAGMISDNALGVTAASLFLWMLNLAIPSLIAAWFPWREEKLRSEKKP